MECKRNKWDNEEGGGGEHFQRRKVQVACLDGDIIEREWRGIMVWSKEHHCWCSEDGKSYGRCGHPVEQCVAECGDRLKMC